VIDRDKRVSIAIADVERRMQTFKEPEETAIAWVVVIHRIAYKIFIPEYFRIKGRVPEKHARFLEPETVDSSH
jgi:hypothetical protein